MKLRTVTICHLLLLGVLVMGIVSPSNGMPPNPFQLRPYNPNIPAADLSFYETIIAETLDATYFPDGREVAERTAADTRRRRAYLLIDAAEDLNRARDASDKALEELEEAYANRNAAKDDPDAAYDKLREAENNLNVAQAKFDKAFKYIEVANERFNKALDAAREANVDPDVIDAAKKAVNADPAKLNSVRSAAYEASIKEHQGNPDPPFGDKEKEYYVAAFVEEMNRP
jgi:hypothetical protein